MDLFGFIMIDYKNFKIYLNKKGMLSIDRSSNFCVVKFSLKSVMSFDDDNKNNFLTQVLQFEITLCEYLVIKQQRT